MVTSLANGKIPFYGIVNNGVKSIKNTYKQYDYRETDQKYQFQGICRDFVYIPSWTISMGGRQLNMVIEDYYITFYSTNSADFSTNKEIAITSYDNPTVVGSVTDYSSAVYRLNLESSPFYASYPYYNTYLKDTGDMLFIRFEGNNGFAELLITSDGYIQVNSSKDLSIYGNLPHEEPNVSSCKNCPYCNPDGSYNYICSEYGSESTTCKWGVSYISLYSGEASDTDLVFNTKYTTYPTRDKSGLFSALIKASTTTGEFKFTYLPNQYISNTGLSESPGVIALRAIKKNYNVEDYNYYWLSDSGTEYYSEISYPYNTCYFLPLLKTYTKETGKLPISLNIDGNIRYLKMTNTLPSSDDTNVPNGLLSICIEGSIYRTYLNKAISENIESFQGIFNNAREVARVFTQGASTSGAHCYWNNVTSFSLSERRKVKEIRLVLKYHPITSKANSAVPNSSYPSVRLFYNTSNADITSDMTYNNCTTIDKTIPSPYFQECILTFPINNYVKQFAIVPAIDYNIVSTTRYSYSITSAVLVMADASEASYTYTL